MQSSSISEILEELQSPSAARQVAALDCFFLLPAGTVNQSEWHSVLTAAVNALESSSNPYPIAERILRFEQEAVAPIANLLSKSQRRDVRALAALILVNNGSRAGVPVLIEEIESSGEYDMMASFALSNAGIVEHVSAIIERLRQCPVPPVREFTATEDDVILGFLKILKQIQVPLPDDIKNKFSAPSVSQFFRDAIASYTVRDSKRCDSH